MNKTKEEGTEQKKNVVDSFKKAREKQRKNENKN